MAKTRGSQGKNLPPALACLFQQVEKVLGARTEVADPEATDAREAFVTRAVAATSAAHIGPALDLAAEAKQAKDGLDERLLALAAHLATKGRVSGHDALRAAKQYRVVMQAITDLDRNASTQLTIESMILRMRQA